jgi:hypothetical protein
MNISLLKFRFDTVMGCYIRPDVVTEVSDSCPPSRQVPGWYLIQPILQSDSKVTVHL